MIEVYTGNPSAGKTTFLAKKALHQLKKNKKLFEKQNYKRKVLSSIKFSETIENEYKGYLYYFDDLNHIDTIRDSDIIIDELSLYFDSHNWEALARRTKKFLRLHRHYGIDIYSATQDFLSVDISFRRLVGNGNLYHFDRVIGSKEPLPNKKAFFPFLFTIKRRVKANYYDKEKIEYKYIGWGRWCFFFKNTFNIFDTHQDFELGALNETTQGYSDLVKVQRVCKEDGFTKVMYK